MATLAAFSRTPFKNDWHPNEAEILLNLIDRPLAIRVFSDDLKPTVYSTLLGFDLCKGELLLDSFKGSNYYELIDLCERSKGLQLSLKLKQGVYLMDASLAECHANSGDYTVSVNIHGARFSASQRLHERIAFEKGHRPAMTLSPNWHNDVKGELLDLSEHGCQLYFPGRDARAQFRDARAGLKVVFNEQFTLECQLNLVQHRFLRSPCCHNRVRALFRDLPSLQQEQLRTFVHTLNYLQPGRQAGWQTVA